MIFQKVIPGFVLIASFQERVRIPDDKMVYYENLAEMYVGKVRKVAAREEAGLLSAAKLICAG